MGPQPGTRALRLLKTVGMIGGLLLLTEVLGGSWGCVVSSCNHDDCSHDDCSHDDDDDSSSSQAQAKPAVDWTLRECKVLPADERGAHPVRSVIDIRGFSLRSKLGADVFGDAEIQQFTSQLLHANEALIGLPEGPGHLRFDAIDHQPGFIRASYVQELVDERDVATLLPGAALRFVLDLQGRLIEIDGSLRLDGGSAVAPESKGVR